MLPVQDVQYEHSVSYSGSLYMRKAFLPLNETCSGKMRKWERSDHMTVWRVMWQYERSCDAVWSVMRCSMGGSMT